MLTQDQIDVISDAIRPLFQYLEHEVIVDIARRINKTMTYTRTAELMAMDMQKLGYSPAKIRAEALKILNADEDYKKEVEKNTLEYKQEVKKLINNITKAAAEAGNDLIANAGNMSWVDDMSVWESAGKQLGEGSFLNQLVDAFGSQTEDQMKNLTKTTGFKSMHGYESIQNAYRHELDKAVIKICSGTFSQGKVLNDVIHDLAQSGLRSIDFESGYSMQLDTAAKLAIRTGCHQISAKIHDANIAQTGENLIYVSRHWGARNKGIGVENHELWQGKVYYIKPGQDYTEEAKRIGQARIMDIWYSTGYSPDGSHPNNPLGLHGYNCRHIHYVFFEGISNIPKENPQPGPFRIDEKEYDYYAMTQKLRSMERNIRALKREKEALGKLGMSQTEINAKIKRKTREYREFCEKAEVPKATSNLRVESGSSDLKTTKAYQEFIEVVNDDSDIGRRIKSLFVKDKPAVINSFRSGISNVKNDDVKILLEQADERVQYIKNAGKQRSYFNKNDGNIYYGTYATPGTIAHELFHETDYIYGLTDNGFLSSSIEKDYRKLTNIAIGYGKSVEELLYYKYPDAFYINERGKKVFYEKYRGISDIINGASDGKVFLGYGHLRSGYWERENMIQKETFAQFGRILYDQDEDVLKMTEEIFENTNREILERIKGMMK